MTDNTDYERTAEHVSTEELQRKLRRAHSGEDPSDVERVSKADLLECFEDAADRDAQDDDEAEEEDDRLRRIKNAFGDNAPDWVDDLDE